MPNRKRIDPNFQPGERVYELLAPLVGDITRAREFCGQELGEFIMYWEGIKGQQATKSNWDSTFLNRMKQVYEYKKEATARSRAYGGTQDNVFQKAGASLPNSPIEKPAVPFKSPARYRLPEPPADTGERLSQDDALEQLSKMFPGGRS